MNGKQCKVKKDNLWFHLITTASAICGAKAEHSRPKRIEPYEESVSWY